ncbi:terminase [Brucella tritici]|uniref:Terminase n=1 Tax=Brucella tritici TaxID=94626 RepID=A0A833FLS5_9HYPH|nr:terminase gpA endonuclease subunit [Brucella tritici]KAB2666794.1 terminase [Brucella tritici]
MARLLDHKTSSGRQARLYELAAILWEPTEKTTPDKWGADNRVYPPTSGKPGERDPFLTPYAVPFTRGFDDHRYTRNVLVTGAQSGKTESILDVIGYRCDTRPVPILYVGPSKDFLTDQFEPRLMGLFDEAPKLKAKLSRGKRMKKTLKRVAGVTVRLAHAGSSTALKSDPAGLALVDEYDEMLANIKGQGDPLGLVEARGITYADFMTGITSTPSQGMVETEMDEETGLEFWKVAPPDDVASPIWKLWQEGTRHHWSWRCPHCREWFVPRFKCLSWPKTATPAQARREAFLECPRNGCVIEESDKAEMNATGVFVAPGQTVDEEGNVFGDPPDTTTLSFWVSGLASPFVSFGERAETYLKALASGDSSKVQTAVNAGFGEVFTPGGGDVPEWEEVARLKAPYLPRTLPDQTIFLTAGVDVQKNRLPFVIRAWGPRATSWLVDSGDLWGETSQQDVWDDLAELLTQPIDGLPIRLAFVDSGFRPGKKFAVPEHRVYEFARRFPRFVFPTKGRRTQSKPIIQSKIEVKSDGKSAKYGLTLHLLDTDHWKSWVHERLRYPHLTEDGRPALGAWYLHSQTTDDYCQQIVSEARTTSPSGTPVWVQRSRENHLLDCEALAAAAGYQLNAHRLGPNARRRDDDDRAEPQIAVPDANGQPQETKGSKFDRIASIAARFNGL